MAAIYSNDTGLRMLQVDADFAPTLSLSDGSKRPWIVNPAGIDRPFPAWGIAYAVLPAIGFAVLGYLDQNLTSVIVNRPSNNLKKPPAYHLDPWLAIEDCFGIHFHFLRIKMLRA